MHVNKMKNLLSSSWSSLTATLSHKHIIIYITHSKPTSPAKVPSNSLGRGANGSAFDLSPDSPSLGLGSPHRLNSTVLVRWATTFLLEGAKAAAEPTAARRREAVSFILELCVCVCVCVLEGVDYKNCECFTTTRNGVCVDDPCVVVVADLSQEGGGCRSMIEFEMCSRCCWSIKLLAGR
jgi:hypothetical protein